jgi:hypothetical protein
VRKTEQNAFAAAGARELTLTAALGIIGDEVVALVGGGGKTTAMFRLACESQRTEASY